MATGNPPLPVPVPPSSQRNMWATERRSSSCAECATTIKTGRGPGQSKLDRRTSLSPGLDESGDSGPVARPRNIRKWRGERGERDLRKIIDRRRPSKERRREGGEREPRGWRRLNRIRIGDAPVTFVLLPFQNGRGSWIYKGRGVVVQVWEEEDYGSL